MGSKIDPTRRVLLFCLRRMRLGSLRLREAGLQVGYGDLLILLGALHPDLERGSIVARLQYLQRQDFPVARRPDVARIDYGAEGLVKLAMAFEVLAAGAPPGTIAPLMEQDWPEVGSAIAGAWLQRADRTFALPIFAKLNGIGGKGRAVGRLHVGTADELRRWMQGAGDERRVLIVDAMRLARAMNRVLADIGTEVVVVVDALNEWAARNPS